MSGDLLKTMLYNTRIKISVKRPEGLALFYVIINL